MRPFFPYYGSKWNIARYYPAPRHGRIVEPFAGGAGYATFYDGRDVLLCDADPIIVGVWDYLINVRPSEIMALPELPNVGDCVDDFDLPQEAKWLIGFWLNRGSATPKKSRTAYSARTDKAQLNWGARAKERIATQVDRLIGWSIRQGDFSSLEGESAATWFIDPPYGDKGRYYRVQFSEFERLGEWARQRQGLVIVCEGTDAKWLPFSPLGSFKTSKGRASEALWVAESPEGAAKGQG